MEPNSPDLKVLTAPQLYNMDVMNGGHLSGQPAFPGQPFNQGKSIQFEQEDPSTYGDYSDGDDEGFSANVQKTGKKTKGRVKIKMEFIENKLRRYTTFSKRKTGIMKKAYELSTLTGTQVMLLVASETGHVYTFATRKLQPMITSESGKALIQTCLNSPDPPPAGPGQQQAVEQRMNPGGFEETELTYAVDDENEKSLMEAGGGGVKPVYTMTASSSMAQEAQGYIQATTPPQAHTQSNLTGQVVQVSTPQPTHVKPSPTTQQASSIAVQLPGLPPGFILQPGMSFTIPVQTSQQSQSQSSQQQATYRFPGSTQPVMTSASLVQADTSQRLQTNGTATVSQPTVSVVTQSGQQAMTPSVFMYQTPQGIVYAPATGTMQDKTIFNLQPSTNDNNGQQQQQPFIIPIPVSLAGSQQVLQFSPPPEHPIKSEPPLSQPTGAKKRKV
ncbi:serum response factor-like isoform X1 [Mya arenaria]|uniref:serum response factor-like isoform X1 n=1 Tax=Mya arenaria TaxID=6604 RepID=UPI0022DEF5A6|nr:serum response factor-like isoform X1 [Mya arenaria]